MAEATAGDAAQAAASAELDAQGTDVDFGEVAQAAAGAAGAAACAAYGLGAAAPLCGWVASELTGFVVDEVLPAIADAWDSIFGSEPEPVLIGPLSDDVKWLNYYRAMTGDVAQRAPLLFAVESLIGAAGRIAPGNWTTETLLTWMQQCGAELEWRTAINVDNRRFLAMETTTTAPQPGFEHLGTQTITRPLLTIVSEKPLLTDALFVPDWEPRFRAAHPFANDWETLQAWYNANVVTWWDRLYNDVLPCVTARLEADAIAVKADLLAGQAASQQLADIAALPPGDQQALADWAALQQLSPEDAQRLRDWAALAALSETERAELRALAEFGELAPDELARLQFVGTLTSGRNFGRFGAVLAAPLGATS